MTSKLPSSLHTMYRRCFLRAGAATLALTVLEAFSVPATPTAAAGAKDLVAIGTYLGWHQNAFFPKQAGRDYEMPETLSRSLACAMNSPSSRSRSPCSQWSWCLSNFLVASRQILFSTRSWRTQSGEVSFPVDSVAAGAGESDSKQGNGISFTRQGVKLPQVQRPSVLYKQLFMSKADRPHRVPVAERAKFT